MTRKHFMLSSLPVSVDTIKPLQQRVLDHDICPVCHAKTLGERIQNEQLSWRQCSGCGNVWIEEPKRELVG